MSDVQYIFDKVIDSGYYNRLDEYMCISLKNAYGDDIITYGEYMYAFDQIKKYLGDDESDCFRDVRSLAGVLILNDLPCSFDDTLAIYKDWENRPELEESL